VLTGSAGSSVVASAYSALRALTSLYVSADASLERLLQAVRLGAEGVLGNALSATEKSELTIHLYDLQAFSEGAQLSAWERAWLSSALPPAPARLLLAAAGEGRELGWLCESGYTVDAFEPATSHVAKLRAHAGERAEIACGSFADLVAAVLRAEPTSLASFGARRYDAVVLGWGSFSHVLEADERAELLRACDRLAGAGPVLASFWLRGEGAIRSRAQQLGAALGRRLSALRGVSAAQPAGQVFRTHCGFAHEFTRAEIDALAGALGRSARWGESGYPRVTFVKTGSGA
jgi:hypothetical protein